jgi:hypothetical protein
MKLKITKSHEFERVEDKLYRIVESHRSDFEIIEIGDTSIVETNDYGWTLLKLNFENLEELC